MKISEKGAVSIYGMGRFPVTLYKEQWLKLLDMSAEIRAFIAENQPVSHTKSGTSGRRERILENYATLRCQILRSAIRRSG